MFLLDTNVVSELRKGRKADPAVTNWSRRGSQTDFFLSVISILEIEYGAHRLKRRDQRQAEMFLQWLEHRLIPAFADRILVVDIAIARRAAHLHVPDPKADRDALIAATALVHGFTVVTRNVRDFEPMGVSTLNPWVQ